MFLPLVGDEQANVSPTEWCTDGNFDAMRRESRHNAIVGMRRRDEARLQSFLNLRFELVFVHLRASSNLYFYISSICCLRTRKDPMATTTKTMRSRCSVFVDDQGISCDTRGQGDGFRERVSVLNSSA